MSEFIFPKDLFLEQRLLRRVLTKDLLQFEVRFPQKGEKMVYSPIIHIFDNSYSYAMFKSEKDEYFLFKPGNRIRREDGRILTLRANGTCIDENPFYFFEKFQQGLRNVNKSLDLKSTTIGTLYGHEGTYFETLDKIFPKIHVFEQGESFEYVSSNVNSELHKIEKRVSRRAPVGMSKC